MGNSGAFHSLVTIIGMLSGVTLSAAATATTITMHSLDAAPVLDGQGQDWSGVPVTSIALKPSRSGITTAVDSVDIKGGVHGDYIYFLVEWQDSTEDSVHKPWVWDKDKGKYVKGPQREDRFALQFAMQGDYSTNWLSGKEFMADMWHWKSTRSNPLGLVHDKSTIISAKKMAKTRAFTADGGGKVYIARPSDAGDKLYTTKRYHKYDQEVRKPTGFHHRRRSQGQVAGRQVVPGDSPQAGYRPRGRRGVPHQRHAGRRHRGVRPFR